MRTTLKRGTRRSEANGHAPIPPDLLSPITRYEARRRGPLRLVGKILLWLVVAVLVGAGALGGGAWLYLNYSIAAVRAHSPEVRAAEKFLDAPLPGAATVAIVIGYDKRPGETADQSRSDTVMLIRADPKLKTVTQMSFPRDLIVDIPGCSAQPAFQGRINEAFTYCGPKGTLKTVKQLTGISVNYMVTVNFRGFIEIVDKIGGVYVDVDRRYFNDNSGLGPGQTYATINLPPGYQRLNGKKALDYVRFRHTDSDFYRIARQHQFVTALKQQVANSFAIETIPGIVKSVTENVEVGTGGSEALDFETLYGYAKLVYGLPAGNFQQVQIEGVSGYAELTVPEESIHAAVDDFLNPDARAPQKAANAATGRKPKGPSAPDSSTVTVQVLNGNGVAGAADEASYELSQRGYQVVNGGNADTFDYFRTRVVYNASLPEAKAAADAMADLFGEADVESAPTGVETPAMLQVVVGQTFRGRLASSPDDKTPEHEPPAVVRDDLIRPHIRAAQRRRDFPLLVPTLRDENSALDTEEPFRSYRIDGEQAFRIVYRMGSGEYWGIQQTSWTDAPLLEGASVTRTIKGRDYKLFFSGARLHTVAFEENDAVYWVTNTLLDKLSNETMLAIAKGLRPLTSR
jgi:LCP family protein required for cell wall assembly